MVQRAILLTGLVVIVCGALPAVADVPISTSLTDVRLVVLDHHRETGNYFAVVQRKPAGSYWRLYLSTDKGASWVQKGGDTLSHDNVVDMVVAGGYVYVGYTHLNSGEARISRFFATDGSRDAFYSYHTVLDVSPANVVDIALASDQDGADAEIYYAFISSNGALRFFVASSSDGTMFSEYSPGVSNACCGLDVTFNPNSADHAVFISYLSTDSKVHVWRTLPWEEVAIFDYFGFDTRTAISASDDNVVLAWQTNLGFGASIIAYTSGDAGDTWDLTYVDSPQFAGDGQFSMVDVTARGSQGFAAVYHQGLGVLDPVFIRRGIDFHPVSWEPRVSINEFDASTWWPVNVNWFPPHHYGIAYIGDDDIPYFDLFDASLFSDDFESGATSAWSATVP